MAMKNNGFEQCNSDHTLFLKHRKGKEISQLQDYLATEFEMKDLGGLQYFLGIEVARSQQGIFLSQRKYVLDLLTDTGMLDCKPADTAIVQNHHLGEYPDQVPTNKERYQSEDHMNAVLWMLIYLKSALGKGLIFSKHGHLNIDGYMQIGQNPVQHDRTKHVKVDRHFIKQKLEAKVFQFPFVKSEDQLADILTKEISSKAFHNSLDQLGIGDIYKPT
ncbi:unnamed protein product [Prunus armeniaca]